MSDLQDAIVAVLRDNGGGPMKASEIAAVLGRPRERINRSCRGLYRCGIIVADNRGDSPTDKTPYLWRLAE